MPKDKERKQKEDLRRKAEQKLRGKVELNLSELSRREALSLLHDLQVHQIELEIQNEELIRAREELSRARDRYADLYDFAPVGYLTLDMPPIVIPLVKS